jgi:hypothetical protein
LKNAYYVSVSADHHLITFRVPRTDEDGFNAVPLQEGHEVTYYCSDTSGDQDHTSTGTVLWRQDYNALTGTTRKRILAEKGTFYFDLMATYSGRVFSVYSNAVTVLSQEQVKPTESSFNTTIAIRNPSVGL